MSMIGLCTSAFFYFKEQLLVGMMHLAEGIWANFALRTDTKTKRVMEQKQVNVKESAARLREQLDKMPWPQNYMFKFVLPNDRVRLDKLLELLPSHGKTTFGNSKTGKYVSVTCVASMASAEAVMEVTTAAVGIEGVISL